MGPTLTERSKKKYWLHEVLKKIEFENLFVSKIINKLEWKREKTNNAHE